MFSCGGDDGSEGGEDLSAVKGAERAGDFHFHLHHPQVLLGQIVGEGDVEIGEEPQRFGFERLRPFEQIAAFALFGASARAGFLLDFRQLAMEGEAEPNRLPIALDEGRDDLGRERRYACLARLIDRGVGVQQQIAHRLGPSLLIDSMSA